MSAKTPDYILQAIVNSAKWGEDSAPVMTAKEWRELVTDMGTWFMWYGAQVRMKAKSVGAGMYIIVGTFVK